MRTCTVVKKKKKPEPYLLLDIIAEKWGMDVQRLRDFTRASHRRDRFGKIAKRICIPGTRIKRVAYRVTEIRSLFEDFGICVVRARR